jgi:hypothetical protein
VGVEEFNSVVGVVVLESRFRWVAVEELNSAVVVVKSRFTRAVAKEFNSIIAALPPFIPPISQF